MSIEQYQRTVNALDKDIADLEKKKAALDKKAAEEQRKAANITINKNAYSAHRGIRQFPARHGSSA
jgi:predicted ribosome quality control (RQC) complex YloA/Tae2 family protein